MSPYDYYCLACADKDRPYLSKWRFLILYSQQQRLIKIAARVPGDNDAALRKLTAKLTALKPIGDLVEHGGYMAGRDDGYDHGGYSSGVREPRSPYSPALSGAAARPLPTSDAFDDKFWRI